ncbi:MAG: hypothetical protein KJ737_02645 [Proteobacteria bacterium]|nr:hypothetical protein [Pseudomonadota bacterium]
MDIAKKEELEARLKDLIKESQIGNSKPEKRLIKTVSGNVIRRRKGGPIKRIM